MSKKLPIGFYDSTGWRDSIVKHYAKEGFTTDALDLPIAALTVGVENLINVYGDHPVGVIKLMKQTVDPLLAPEEYESDVYEAIKKEAVRLRDPYIERVANSLYYMRLIFQKDYNYISKHFKSELAQIEGNSEREKVDKLAEKLSMIVKTHTKQVANMITKHCAVA